MGAARSEEKQQMRKYVHVRQDPHSGEQHVQNEPSQAPCSPVRVCVVVVVVRSHTQIQSVQLKPPVSSAERPLHRCLHLHAALQFDIVFFVPVLFARCVTFASHVTFEDVLFVKDETSCHVKCWFCSPRWLWFVVVCVSQKKYVQNEHFKSSS